VVGLGLDPLRILRTYEDIQKVKVQVHHRIKQTRFTVCKMRHMIPLKKDRSRDRCPVCGGPAEVVEVAPPKPVVMAYQYLAELEKLLERELEHHVEREPLYEAYLSRIKGVGVVTAAYLIYVLNPAKFETVSKMYKYTGLHVVNGRAARKSDGGFSPKLKSRILFAARRFAGMVENVYTWFYWRVREEAERKHPDWTEGHIFMHSVRLTAKKMLSDWYVVGRVMQGLPYRVPYPCVLRVHECIPPMVDDLPVNEPQALREDWLYNNVIKKILPDYGYTEERYLQLVRSVYSTLGYI
jgi:hypothetical protein